MSANKNTNVNLLRALSGQENTFTTPKLYVRLTKCHVRGLVLNQLIFYSDKSTRHRDDWFDKSYAEWRREIYIEERTLRSIFKEFEDKKWCETKVIKVNGLRTLVIRPLLDNILSDIEQLLGCAESEPTGKNDRIANRQIFPDSQPANFSVSYTIETEDYLQNILCADSEESAPPRDDLNPTTKNQPTRFERFWQRYPSKKAKKLCREIWSRKKLDNMYLVIMERLSAQIDLDANWRKGYIPNPSTYLNQERWYDDISGQQKKLMKPEGEIRFENGVAYYYTGEVNA